MITVYTISGLGADQRLFDRLKLPPGFDIAPLPWVQPSKGDSIADYAARMAESISTDNPILLGVSFGGMIALELSRLVSAPLTIVVSSVKTRRELPWYYRLAGRLRLHRLSPGVRTRLTRTMVRLFNSANTDEARQLLDAMIADVDPVFSQWAIDRLLSWPGCRPFGTVRHIHGTADRMLPCRFVNADILIEGGSHLMIYTDAERVNNTIARVLTEFGS